MAMAIDVDISLRYILHNLSSQLNAVHWFFILLSFELYTMIVIYVG